MFNHLKCLLLKSLLVASMLCLHFISTGQSRREALDRQITEIAEGFEGKVGVGVMRLDFPDTLLVNDDVQFAMQSVYKLPLAIAMLDKVDRKELSLQKKVRFKKSKLMQETWSPMLRDCKAEDNEMTVAQLLQYSVSKSDNNACDLLFELVGGVGVVDRYCKRVGVKKISISATERQMAEGWDVQYTNWCTPSGMLQLLGLLYKGKLLKPSSKDFLIRLMVESENSPQRLKGMLPEKAVVAHKTGTSNTNEEGIMAVTNDVGIVTLPNGLHYAIVVYLKDYKGGIAKGEKAIASISKAVWDHYNSEDFAPEVEMRELHLVDASRNREIDVAVYMPTGKVGRKGVVVINPGYEPGGVGSHRAYSYIANFLAVRGYLVLGVRHDLQTDPPIPREGNMQVVRKPFWETGVKNIEFVLRELEGRYKSYDFRRITLMGHSNGGDIAALFATRYPDQVNSLITLDNRRFALPRTRKPKVYSLRSSDQPADTGVLPDEAEQEKYNMQIVRLPNTIHNDMGNNGTTAQKAEINGYVARFLGIY